MKRTAISHQVDRLLTSGHRSLNTGFTVWLVALWCCAFAHAASPAARLPENHLALFETYCYKCHDSGIEAGEVNLETVSSNIGENIESAELWQKVLNALNSGKMPPEGAPQIPDSEKTALLDDLSNQLVVARKILSDSGGKITLRRLNRREYRNTIEHLTGVTVDVGSLPVEGGSGAFDTVGAAQFISSDQFEQYLKLGREAIDEAFDRRAATEPKTFRLEPETVVNPDNEQELKKIEDDQERFLLWKAEVDKAAAAPENREIMARLRREDPKIDESLFTLYRRANQLIGTPDPTEYGFRDNNRATQSFQGGYHRKHAYFKHYVNLPHRDQGTYLKLAWGTARIVVSPPWDMPPGTYRMRIRAGTAEGAPSFRRFIEIGHPQRENALKIGLAGFPISSHQITGTIERPSVVETQLEVGIHTPREFAIQERQPSNRLSLRDAFNVAKRANGYCIEPAIWIDCVEL